MTSDKELILADIQDKINKFMKINNVPIECDSGWYPLILELNKRLNQINPTHRILQIKEKFGSLRYYFELPQVRSNAPASERKLREQQYADMQELVKQYEYFSSITCECCGDRGEFRAKNYWYKTLCESCRLRLGYNANGAA